VTNIRSLGMVAAFDLKKDKTTGQRYAFDERIGFRAYEEGLKEGLLLRPLGDTIYYWLPLCTTTADVKDIVERTLRVLRTLNM
jgi:adenosylmethionine-8-amino-7-oxononanoate aminotransferase